MFERYAIYYTPQGALAEVGAAWMGWDVARGVAVDHAMVGDLDLAKLTRTPRKYGLHGTIKPPFVLRGGTDATALEAALSALSQTLSPVMLAGLEVTCLGRIVTLTPCGDQTGLAQLATEVVTRLDNFRELPSEQELAKRRKKSLSPEQDQHLRDWGYPYVLDQFRFHMTLTGWNEQPEVVRDLAAAHFAPYLSDPVRIDSLTLVGQNENGMFVEIARYPLSGTVLV